MIITILHSSALLFYFISLFFFFFHGSNGATITIVNRCSFTVWPGISSNSGSGDIGTTGFELASGASRSFQAPPSWSGRFWARTGCNFDSDTGQGTCLTGDCGSNQVECNGAGANPPVTLAEFTIGSGPVDPTKKQDFYDVSLVDGYNIPMVIEPSGGISGGSEGSCLTTGCVTDLNQKCPTELRFGSGSACKSACEAFGNPEYCCSGSYSSPNECKPSIYSEIFKTACPRSYSYAFDDATSTFTCINADYTITLCPYLPSQKSAANGWRREEAESSSSPLSTWLSDVFNSHSSNIHQSSSQYLLSLAIFFVFGYFDLFLIFGCIFCILLHLYYVS